MFSLKLIYSSSFKNHQCDGDFQISFVSHQDFSLKYQMHTTWDSVLKNPPANAGDIRDVGLIPGSGRPPWKENGDPYQYSCLGNSTNRGACQAIVHGNTSDRTHTMGVCAQLCGAGPPHLHLASLQSPPVKQNDIYFLPVSPLWTGVARPCCLVAEIRSLDFAVAGFLHIEFLSKF